MKDIESKKQEFCDWINNLVFEYRDSMSTLSSEDYQEVQRRVEQLLLEQEERAYRTILLLHEQFVSSNINQVQYEEAKTSLAIFKQKYLNTKD